MTTFHRGIASIPGSQRVISGFTGLTTIHATSEETGGVFGIWESDTPPGKGPHWHTHTRETEVFCVITGTYRFYCGDEVFDGGPGTVVTLPPFVPHRFENIGETKGTVLAIVSPGGFERLFLEINRNGVDTPSGVLALETELGIINSGLEKLVNKA